MPNFFAAYNRRRCSQGRPFGYNIFGRVDDSVGDEMCHLLVQMSGKCRTHLFNASLKLILLVQRRNPRADEYSRGLRLKARARKHEPAKNRSGL